MIEADTAVGKTCATIERKYGTVIEIIDKYIEAAIKEGQFTIQIKQEIFEEEIGLYLNNNKINSILRVFEEHGYKVCNQVSGDIYISW